MPDFTQVWKTGEPQRSARIGFATPELLWKVLTEKRRDLPKALCGAGQYVWLVSSPAVGP